MRASLAIAALALAGAAGSAHADGYYYSESIGFASARGADMAALDATLHTRASIGYRYGAVSVEPWLSVDLAFDREGASFEVLGGAPAMGRADLEGGGVDVRVTEPLGRGFQLYTRVGPRYASALGALGGYSGFGIGGGTGVALVGRVRALGFLWAPLFFTKRGPNVLAALFADEGVDLYALHGSGLPAVTAPVVATSIGFAVGTDF